MVSQLAIAAKDKRTPPGPEPEIITQTRSALQEWVYESTYNTGDEVLYTTYMPDPPAEMPQYFVSSADDNTGNDPTSGSPWVEQTGSPADCKMNISDTAVAVGKNITEVTVTVKTASTDDTGGAYLTIRMGTTVIGGLAASDLREQDAVWTLVYHDNPATWVAGDNTVLTCTYNQGYVSDESYGALLCRVGEFEIKVTLEDS